jgi:hypothetical protein
MMREIVEATVRMQIDMQLVNRRATEDLESELRDRDADVVILAASAVSPRLPGELLVAHPSIKVVVIKDDGRAANLLELRSVHVANPSPSGLIVAIRRACHMADS